MDDWVLHRSQGFEEAQGYPFVGPTETNLLGEKAGTFGPRQIHPQTP